MTTRQKEWVVGGTTFGAIFGGFFAGFVIIHLLKKNNNNLF
jgi:SP family myo-inositol transporter-like MFS transporter 13